MRQFILNVNLLKIRASTTKTAFDEKVICMKMPKGIYEMVFHTPKQNYKASSNELHPLSI